MNALSIVACEDQLKCENMKSNDVIQGPNFYSLSLVEHEAKYEDSLWSLIPQEWRIFAVHFLVEIIII